MQLSILVVLPKHIKVINLSQVKQINNQNDYNSSITLQSFALLRFINTCNSFVKINNTQPRLLNR